MKKVLAAVVAAAMALSMSVSAFAATAANKYPALERDRDIPLVDAKGNPYEAGDVVVTWDPTNPTTIKATENDEFKYTVTAYGNMYDTREFTEADRDTLDVFIINYWNYEPSISVKGPAEVVNARIDSTSFDYNYTAPGNLLAITFDVTFKLEATNEDATDMKGVVVTYGAKTVDVPSRSGFKGKTEKTNEGDLAVGYTNEDLDDLYDTVVAAFDDMIDYEEDSFEVDMEGNPVIPLPSSVSCRRTWPTTSPLSSLMMMIPSTSRVPRLWS